MTADQMKQDATVTINWFRVNFPTIVTLAGVLWFMASQTTAINSRLDVLDQDRTERSSIADRNYASINATLEAMRGQNIPYRVGQAEIAVAETRQRMDQLQQTLLGQIELIRKDLNRLTTQVEVMSTRVGMLTGDVDDRGRPIGKQRPVPN